MFIFAAGVASVHDIVTSYVNAETLLLRLIAGMRHWHPTCFDGLRREAIQK